MKKHLFTSFLFMLLLASSALSAKDVYKFRTLSPEGGFYYDGVSSIQQDKSGFMWVLMPHDLCRFDGYKHKSYNQRFAEMDHTVDWIFYSMEIDKTGRFFVNTNNGLYLYDAFNDQFERIYDLVIHVKVDNRENVWVYKNRRWGILNLETKELKTPPFHGKETAPVATVFCTNNNDLYLLGKENEIYRFNYEESEFVHCFKLPKTTGSIVKAQAHKGKLWVLIHKEGLYKIDLSTFIIEEQFDVYAQWGGLQVRSFFVDIKGSIWIGTIKGLYVLNPEKGSYAHFTHSEMDSYSIPNNSIWTINEDRQKNVWIGTYSGGLCYVNLNEKTAFTTYHPSGEGLNLAPVSAFAEDKDYLWVGTEGGGLNCLDKKSERFSYILSADRTDGLSFNNIKSLVIDKREHLWIAMYQGGLDCYDKERKRFDHFKRNNETHSLLDNNIRKIVLESDSGLWIAYQRKSTTLSYFSFKTKRCTHYELEKSDKEHFLYDIMRGKGDELWAISNKKLYLLDIQSSLVKVIPQQDSLFMNFQTFCMDDSGLIWLGTIGNGLICYNPHKSEYSHFREILKNKIGAIYSICYDHGGYLWLGTDNGLIKYHIADNSYFRYDKKDGVQGQSYYPLAAMRGMGGVFYFGGTNGFTIVDSEKLSVNEYQPTAVISDFFINHQSAKLNYDVKDKSATVAEVVLDYDQTTFGFEFSSDNFLIPEKNRFKYRLRGYDDQWITVDATNRTAMYSKIQAGNYYFELLAANNDWVWSERPTVIKVKRKPAPWWSWQAYLFYVILLFLLTYIVWRYYNEKKKLEMRLYLENVEKDKKEQIHQAQLSFFMNISHDFRTPLSLIKAAVDRLRQEGLKEYYYRILNNNSLRLLNLVNELMDFKTVENGKMRLSVEEIDINHFIENIGLDFSDYAKQRQIDFTIITAPPPSSALYVDKQIVEKICMNLLNNAFKYSGDNASISIETIFDTTTFTSKYRNSYTVRGDSDARNSFFIVVRDTGVGISKEAIADVFERFYKVNTVNADSHLGTGIGLALVKSLVLLHKGAITIYSERDKGTDMLVELPLDPTVYEPDEFITSEHDETPSDHSIDQSYAAEEHATSEEEVLLRKKKRVLLAEDNHDLRELLAGALSDEYDVVEAEDGLQAEQLVADLEVDIIISDIMMPQKDGITFCREIKSDINTSHIPFILLTAKTGLDSKIEGADSGADIYFEKPIDLQLLKLSIQNIFKQQQQLREHYAKNYFADSSELTSNEHDNDFLKKIIATIELNIDQSTMDVNFIATELSMSRSKLYTKIKTLTGKSIVEFILTHRLRKAARLIIEEDLTMREVMSRIGIESQPYFTNAFKKEFGDPPTKFAAKHKQKNKK